MRKLIICSAACAAIASVLLPLAGPSSATTVAPQAGATNKCQDQWRNFSGGSWSTGSNWSVGAPPTSEQSACISVGAGASVDLTGPGAARSLTIASSSGAAQLALLDGTLTVGALDNEGTILTGAGSGTLATTPGGLLVNAGLLLGPVGTLNIAGNLDNVSTGTVAIEGGFWLKGAVTLDNHGTISLAPGSNFNTTAGVQEAVDNDGGTIANAGTFNVLQDATFVERSGTTTGNPLRIMGGALELRGPGASSFMDNGFISGNISRRQTVDFWSGGPTVVNAAGSFTNHGLIGGPASGSLVLPRGATLTNEGTINEASWYLEGNLVNAPTGTMYVPGQLNFVRQGTTFLNAGKLYLPFGGHLFLNGSPRANQPSAETFRNTGALYMGVGARGAVWGSFGLASSIESYGGNRTFLGGRVVPLPWGEPSPWEKGQGTTIVYGITGDTSDGYRLACPAVVLGGWSLGDCGRALAKPAGAVLTDHLATTLNPTQISVAGSGQVNGTVWKSRYGEPVKLTAIVTAQNGVPPTGTVTFLDQVQPVPTAMLTPALLGTARLFAHGSQVVASIVTRSLPPASYMLLAIYSGDRAHLPASTGSYSGYLAQQVAPQATTVSLSRSDERLGASSATFTASVVPRVSGPASPTGEVELINHANGDVVAEAPLTTNRGMTRAVIRTTLTGATSLIATYSGDYDYSGSSSPALDLPAKA